jgi:hypothetical protein
MSKYVNERQACSAMPHVSIKALLVTHGSIEP